MVVELTLKKIDVVLEKTNLEVNPNVITETYNLDFGKVFSGKSAYEIAVDKGFVGTEEEWLASLKKPAEDAKAEAEVAIGEMRVLEQQVDANETARKSAEISRVFNEEHRVANETNRVAEERKRVSAEALRESNEGTRKSNESERVSAENVRKSAEISRNQSEEARRFSEQIREQNEEERKANEEERKKTLVGIEEKIDELNDDVTLLDSALTELGAIVDRKEDAGNKVDNADIVPSTQEQNKYPSVKALKDYVASHSGGGGTTIPILHYLLEGSGDNGYFMIAPEEYVDSNIAVLDNLKQESLRTKDSVAVIICFDGHIEGEMSTKVLATFNLNVDDYWQILLSQTLFSTDIYVVWNIECDEYLHQETEYDLKNPINCSYQGIFNIIANADLSNLSPSGVSRIEEISKVKEIEEKIKDIELFKFPNVTIKGTPTIQSGQVSGFTTEDYLQFPFILDLHNQAFQIDFCFVTGDDITTQQNVLDSKFGLALAIANGKGIMAISSNGTSWDIGSKEGVISIQPNTTYYARLSWDKAHYVTALSTDGVSYVDDIVIASGVRPYPTTIYIGGCDAEDTGHTPHPFGGSINMNKAFMSVNGNVVWQGMDDAGLSTRLATDLSNLDANGREVIDGIARDRVFVATYGETTYDDIVNAYNDGKEVKMISGSYIYRVSQFAPEQNVVRFNSLNTEMSRLAQVTSENKWSVFTYPFEKTDHRQNVLTKSEVNYPSSKGVVDYVKDNAVSFEEDTSAEVVPMPFVEYVEQSLTEEQKAQARKNIGVGKWGVISQKQNWVGAYSDPKTYTMSDIVYGEIPQANIDLFRSKGATFNEQSGYFELNGLTDISYEEMLVINSYKGLQDITNTGNELVQCPARTLYPRRQTTAYANYFQWSGNGYLRSAYCEVLNFDESTEILTNRAMYMGACPLFATNSDFLKRILGAINLSSSAPHATFLQNCFTLEEVRITNLKFNLTSINSKVLSPYSIHYMIVNADSTTAKTLQFSAEAKARWEASEYYEEDSALLVTKKITIA